MSRGIATKALQLRQLSAFLQLMLRQHNRRSHRIVRPILFILPLAATR